MEAMFALFLTFVVLSGLVYTLQQASRARSAMQETGTVSEIYHASSLIRNDLAAAESLITPNGGTSPALVLELIMPTETMSIEARPTEGDPYLPSERVRVEYRLVDGVLRRTRQGNGFTENVALLELEDFQVKSRSGQALIEFEFTVANQRRARTYTIIARLRP